MVDIGYTALMISGFFTGIGVVAGQHVYELFIRRKVIKAKKHIDKVKKRIVKKDDTE